MRRIRKDDEVVVIAGKDKGRRGKIVRVMDEERVIVAGVNLVKRHTKPTQKNQQGGILEKEGSVHISNVMPIDPGTDKPTRVKIVAKDGVRLRVGKSGAPIEAEKQ